MDRTVALDSEIATLLQKQAIITNSSNPGPGFCSHFLAPPAERQRSFSNADSSVVRRPSSVVRRPSSSSVVVNFSIKSLISQKLSDNFFSFLACSFLRMVPMHSKNMDLVESS